MAQLYPTEQEAQGFEHARAAAAWVGLAAEPWAAVQVKTGSFADRLRNVALLPAHVIRAAVAATRLPAEGGAAEGRPLTPVEAAQVGLIWRIARRLQAPAWADFVDIDPLDAPAPAAAPPTQPGTGGGLPGGGAAAGATPAQGRKVKLGQVLVQGDETEVPVATDPELEAWHNNWKKFALGPPEEEEEPSVDQLTALNTRVVAMGDTPYADFALFTPYGRRVQRAHKFMAFMFQPDGSWINKEVPGPNNFEAWDFCWSVFRVAAVMLDIIPEVALSKYRACIATLAREWPECWSIVYLADDKMRMEGLRRMRSRIKDDMGRGLQPPPLWDESKPWGACFLAAAETESYWNKHVRNLCVKWMSKAKEGSAPVTREQEVADAAIAGGAAAIAPPPTQPGAPGARGGLPQPWGQGLSSGAKTRRRAREASRPPADPPQPKQPKGNGKGKNRLRVYIRTLDGKPLCFAWNEGQEPCKDPNNHQCSRGFVHACTKCRSTEHPARRCPQ